MKSSFNTNALHGNIIKILSCWALLLFTYINQVQACPVENKYIEININGNALTTEVAANVTSHLCGLAFRHYLPSDHGMLFAYEHDKIIAFWMKNTIIHLSIAFLDSDGKILEIHDMDPHNPTKHYTSKFPARYGLEVNKGWFSENGIKVGDRAVFNLPADPEIFKY